MAATVRSASTYASTATEASTSGLTLPSGWQPGDVIYIGCELTAATGSITTPGGWTAVVAQFVSAVGSTPTSGHTAVFRRVMQSGDTDPVISFTSGRFAAAMVAVQGADNGTPEDVTPATDDNTGVTAPSVRAPSITPVTAGCLLITFHAVRNITSGVLTSFTPDASETEQADAGTGVAAVSEAAVEAATLALADTSATGTKTATATGSNVTSLNMMGAAVAVRPAATAGGPLQAAPGQTWLRRFHHRQVSPPPVSIITAVAPVLPAPAVITARRQPPRRPLSRFAPPAQFPPVAGAFLQATRRRLPPRPRPRLVTGMLPGSGVAFVPPPSPLTQAKRQPPRRPARGTLTAGAPPRIPTLPAASAARRQPVRRPRGFIAGPLAPPAVAAAAVLPAPKPLQAARRVPQPRPRGRFATGLTPGSGVAFVPPVTVLAAAARRQPPRRPRGQLTGPLAPGAVAAAVLPPPRVVAAAWRRPLRRPRGAVTPGLPPVPVIKVWPPFTQATRRPPPGRSRPLRLYAPLQPPPPPPAFTIGALTAADKGTSTLTAAGAASVLTASTAPSGALTATDQRTGGPG